MSGGLAEFLHMGGYAPFVWSAYGIWAAVMVWMIVTVQRRATTVRRTLLAQLRAEELERDTDPLSAEPNS